MILVGFLFVLAAIGLLIAGLVQGNPSLEGSHSGGFSRGAEDPRSRRRAAAGIVDSCAT